MDRNEKFLNSLSTKEFETLAEALILIKANRFAVLDVKKLTGHKNIFRVRVGNIRIIFSKSSRGIEIEEISRRSDNTYKNF